MCEAHNHGADEQATKTAAHDHGSHDHGAAGADSETAECRVMPGSFVNKAEAEAAGLTREYDGTTYYLCCAACGPLFDADPAKYAGAAA